MPPDVYSLAQGFKSINGISFLANKEIGPGILQGELIVGEGTSVTQSTVDFGATKTTSYARIKDGVAMDLSYELEHHLTTRLSYTQGNVNVEADTTAPDPTVPSGGNTVFITPLDIRHGRFFSGGMKYDSESFFASGEFVRRLLEGNALNRASAFYLMAGYNIGKWSPNYTYSGVFDLVGTNNLHPDPNLARSASLQTGGHTNIFGINYHATESVVAKFSYSLAHQDYTDVARNLNFNVFQATVDFVF